MGKGYVTGIHSGQRGQIGQDFAMIRLASSGSNCSMDAGSRKRSVNSAYTPHRYSAGCAIAAEQRHTRKMRGKRTLRSTTFISVVSPAGTGAVLLHEYRKSRASRRCSKPVSLGNIKSFPISAKTGCLYSVYCRMADVLRIERLNSRPECA